MRPTFGCCLSERLLKKRRKDPFVIPVKTEIQTLQRFQDPGIGRGEAVRWFFNSLLKAFTGVCWSHGGESSYLERVVSPSSMIARPLSN
jgi:hypothetical protein